MMGRLNGFCRDITSIDIKLIARIMMTGMFLVCAISFSRPLIADDLFIELAGRKERLRGLELDTMQVCTLKARVAQLFDIKMKKFDLVKGGVKLRPGKTLKDAGGNSFNRLNIRTVNNSQQC